MNGSDTPPPPREFCKRPVVVEAMQYDGTPESAAAMIEWCDLEPSTPGRWWIKHKPGHVESLSAADFAATYEPVATPAVAETPRNPFIGGVDTFPAAPTWTCSVCGGNACESDTTGTCPHGPPAAPSTPVASDLERALRFAAVTQDRVGAEGNCFAACIATIFGVPLAEVMGWYHSDDKHAGQYVSGLISKWLAGRGLIYVEVPRGNLTMNATDEPKRETRTLGWSPLFSCDLKPLVVLCGKTDRGFQHCVVGRTNGWFVEQIHDPHPSRAGIPDIDAIGFFVALDPGSSEMERPS